MRKRERDEAGGDVRRRRTKGYFECFLETGGFFFCCPGLGVSRSLAPSPHSDVCKQD